MVPVVPFTLSGKHIHQWRCRSGSSMQIFGSSGLRGSSFPFSIDWYLLRVQPGVHMEGVIWASAYWGRILKAYRLPEYAPRRAGRNFAAVTLLNTHKALDIADCAVHTSAHAHLRSQVVRGIENGACCRRHDADHTSPLEHVVHTWS